jgi:hypothetical protein
MWLFSIALLLSEDFTSYVKARALESIGILVCFID